ncbi:MAG: hypothetical protein LBO69_02355 [Ignavibacteria bacterium]|jgi:hypothetical protein|nr:hypothetical protein [Ignavibacteria bacterium]
MRYIASLIFALLLAYSNLSADILLDTSVVSSPTTGASTDGLQYSPEQDSAYIDATRLSLNFMFWLRNGLDMSETYWSNWLNQYQNTPTNNLLASFEKMPANIFAPLSSELVQYQLNKMNALSVPGVTTFSENGMHIGLRSIGVFLGLLEDTSPDIKYTLHIEADVEVVVYSVNAKVIAIIFHGYQKPGTYKFTWNGRDNMGKKVQQGDYIAEVRIGIERYVRKRIVIE